MPKSSLFVTTRWSVVCDASGSDNLEADRALESLCKTYWQPLYRYVRRIGKTQQDAEDLVQGFFAQMFCQKAFKTADPERGKFRMFLLGSLKNFMANEWQKDHRLKRGGFAPHLSLDWEEAETGLKLELEDHQSPDRLYDRDWALALLDKVLEELEGEEPDFARWKPFLTLSSARIRYDAVATEFGMTEGAVRVAVHRFRKRYRHRLREEITQTLARPDLIEEEMQALFAALRD